MSGWTHPDLPHAGGQLDLRFEALGQVFADQLNARNETGAAFAAIRDGEILVDIRGGFVDRQRQTPWGPDTIASIYSVGKAVLSLLTAAAVSAGSLDYERAVADDWPEFGAGGKDSLTLAQVMSHQAGLCGFPTQMSPEDWLDWDLICRRLAQMTPLWEPGSANGYHPQTGGFIIGELIKKKTGKSVGGWLKDMRARDGLQIFCGMDADDLARASYMRKPPKAPDLGEMNDFKAAAFLKPWSAPTRVAVEDWVAAEIPASNMHADALSLAKLLQPFVNGGRWLDGRALIDAPVLEAAFRERIRGDDLVLPFNISWSAGLMRNTNKHYGPNVNAFGHAGFGGACVVVDPENRLTAAYVTNTMSPHLVGDPRAIALLDAFYENL